MRFDHVWFRYAPPRGRGPCATVDADRRARRDRRRARPQRRRQVDPAPARRRRAAPGRGARSGDRPPASAGSPSASRPTSRSPRAHYLRRDGRACAACAAGARPTRWIERLGLGRARRHPPGRPLQGHRAEGRPRPGAARRRPACWCSTSRGRAWTPPPATLIPRDRRRGHRGRRDRCWSATTAARSPGCPARSAGRSPTAARHRRGAAGAGDRRGGRRGRGRAGRTPRRGGRGSAPTGHRVLAA